MIRDNTKTTKTPYYYNDNEMYFSFNTIHSSKYNLFIVNNNDLKFVNKTTKSISYETPLYQNWSYLLNASQSQKEISLNLAAEGLTSAQCEEVFRWLKVGETGLLVLDYDTFWGWNVVVSELGDANYYQNENGYIISFSVKFTTVGSYSKRSIIDSYCDFTKTGDNYIFNFDNSTHNEYGLPQFLKYSPVSTFPLVGSIQYNDLFSGNYNLIFNFSCNFETDKEYTIYLLNGQSTLVEYNVFCKYGHPFTFKYNSENNLFLSGGSVIENDSTLSVNKSVVNLMKKTKLSTPKLLTRTEVMTSSTYKTGNIVIKNKIKIDGDGEYLIYKENDNSIYLYDNTILTEVPAEYDESCKYYLIKDHKSIDWRLYNETDKVDMEIYPRIELITYKEV